VEKHRDMRAEVCEKGSKRKDFVRSKEKLEKIFLLREGGNKGRRGKIYPTQVTLLI